MAKMKKPKPPKVRIAKPAGRPYQLRYTDPETRKEVRISTGTMDEAEASEAADKLRAKLTLGMKPERKHKPATGPSMPWTYFRREYTDTQLCLLRSKSAIDAESRLDLAERILSPATLADVANADALHRLQAKLLAGVESKYGRPRSAHTVKGYMGAVLAALNWARMQGYIPAVPAIRKVQVGKLKAMKGRPITQEEFERMLSSVESGLLKAPAFNRKHDGRPKRKYTLSDKAKAEHQKRRKAAAVRVADSWRYLLRGAWASALRLEELMMLSWDIPDTIQPEWPRRGLPVLRIPGSLQKNGVEEEIPLLPWLETVLLETPPERRTGWVFNPEPLHGPAERPTAEWVGRVISRIGEAAGVVVDPGSPRTGRPAKAASAHDLRRSCAARLRDAEVPPMVITAIMRHSSWETTRRHYAPGAVQENARVLRKYLVKGLADEHPQNSDRQNSEAGKPTDSTAVFLPD